MCIYKIGITIRNVKGRYSHSLETPEKKLVRKVMIPKRIAQASCLPWWCLISSCKLSAVVFRSLSTSANVPAVCIASHRFSPPHLQHRIDPPFSSKAISSIPTRRYMHGLSSTSLFNSTCRPCPHYHRPAR